MWEADREFARGIDRAKEDISESIATFLAGVELLYETGGGIGDPGFCERLARRENNDGWFACVDDGFD